jgi:hypothetical protein
MSPKINVGISVFVSILICLSVVSAQTGSPITGQWTMGGIVVQDQVQFGIQRSTGNANMNSSSVIPLSQLRGLTRAHMDSPGTPVAFEIVRDAGTFQLQGFLQGGRGGGPFRFLPNANFANEMRALGYSGLSEEKVFVMAMHDVSIAYVRGLSAEGIRPESVDKLLSMRIHNVTTEYVRAMRDLGYSTELTPDKLVTMRIHNVTVDFVRDLGGLGYSNVTPDKLVTMRIHGVTTDFARALKTMGYNSVLPEQMVTMRIHGVSEEFIKEIEGLGYNRPPIQQLVTMRIHGITPDSIRQIRARGFGNLSIDQIVRMKLQGILD